MQKQNKPILVVLGVTLLLGLNHNNSLLKGAGRTTVTVLPSGDTSGVTDWVNLNAAFEEANALTGFGPGTTVKLGPGIFYIDKPLLVSNFSGKLQGAGRVMDVGESGTTITNAPQGKLRKPRGRDKRTLFPLGDFGDPQIPAFPTFFTFYLDNNWDPNETANIKVSDLTTHWSGATVPWALESDNLVIEGLLSFFWVPGRLTGTNDPSELSLVNTTWHNLEMTADGPILPEDAINIFNLVTFLVPDFNGDGIQAAAFDDIKPIKGNQEISNVYIENIIFPIFMTGIDDSEVLVNGVIVNNPDIVARCCQTAVIICDSSNTAFTVTNLETTNAPGVAFPQGHWRDSQITASTYLLSHSTIQKEGGFAKIFLNDGVNSRTGIPTIKAKLEQNTLIGTAFAPISSGFVDDLIVSRNIISGSGTFAIRVSGGKDGVIHDNQVSGFNPFVADILLSSTTSGFIVFGNDPTDTVLDFGTDNIIVNANFIPKSARDNKTEQEMNKRLREF